MYDPPIEDVAIVVSTGRLMLQVVKVLVDKPEEVDLRVVVSDREVHMTLIVAPEDRMSVIGKHGVILHAIRAILATINSKSRYQFRLEIGRQ